MRLAILLLPMVTGCFAEVTGGLYKVSESGVTLPGQEVKPKGFGVGLNVGVFYDYKQTVRASVGGGATYLPADLTNGTALASAQTVGAQVDYEFLGWGDNRTLAASGALAFGQGSNKLSPMGGTETTGTGSGALDVFGGLTITLPFAHSNFWAYDLSVGAEYLRAPSSVGDFTAIGPGARVRLAYSPFVWIKKGTEKPGIADPSTP